MEPISSIQVQCLTSDEAAVTHLKITSYGAEHLFVGHAKKHPKDQPDEAIGVELSLGRALQRAADFFLEDSSSMIEDNETFSQASEEAKALLQAAALTFGMNQDYYAIRHEV